MLNLKIKIKNMKQIKYISLFLVIACITVSCEKHIIEHSTEAPLDANKTEFLLHYFEPVNALPEYYIYKILINDQLYTNNTAVLSTYNAQPSGAVGKFFTADAGAVNIKLFRLTDPDKEYGDDNLTKVYDQTVTLPAGKKNNLFVHDLTLPPVVLDSGFPYPERPAAFESDTITWVKFFNFLYEDQNTPTTMRLQYQYQYTLHPIYTLEDEINGRIPEGKRLGDATEDATKSPWLNLGAPVGFGETTGWQPVPVKRTAYIAAADPSYTGGSPRIDYRIVVSAENGGVPGVTVMNNVDWVLRRMNNSTTLAYGAYSDYWTGYVGVGRYHVFSGCRVKPTASFTIANVRSFGAW
jgi:hypothetical protein